MINAAYLIKSITKEHRDRSLDKEKHAFETVYTVLFHEINDREKFHHQDKR